MFFCSFLPLARVFQCLFTFVLVSASGWLAEIWQLSGRSATGELDRVNSHSRDIVASSPSFTPLTRSLEFSSWNPEFTAKFSVCKTVFDYLANGWHGALGVLNFVYSWTSTTATLETEESGRCREVAILERFKDSK